MNNKEFNKAFSKRLQQYMAAYNMTQAELAKRLGVGPTSVYNWYNGVKSPRMDRVDKMCEIFHCNRSDLIEDNSSVPVLSPAKRDIIETISNMPDDDANRIAFAFQEADVDNIISLYPELQSVDLEPVPLVGDVACGQPIVANREYETYVMADSKIRKKVNFCVRAKGDSMINARIYDGDVVFIKKMPTVDDGDIAAVIIEDSVTLKRVYYDKAANRVTLAAENPSYAPLIYQGEELDHIQILGKAIFFQSNIK